MKWTAPIASINFAFVIISIFLPIICSFRRIPVIDVNYHVNFDILGPTKYNLDEADAIWPVSKILVWSVRFFGILRINKNASFLSPVGT